MEKKLEEKIHLVVEDVIKSFMDSSEERRQVLNSIDIKKIPIEDLRRGYFDYRLAPLTFVYGESLNEPCPIKEAIMDIAPPDTVVRKIIRKYHLPSNFVNKIEHFHKIYVYSITAEIGNNEAFVDEDMRKLGYFLSVKGDIVNIDNMAYRVLVFEPLSQMQDDITDKVKANYNVLYHWTPVYRLNSILKDGLKPKSENWKFSFPPRIYLIAGDATDGQRIYLGRLLCAQNNSLLNNGMYALLEVNIKGLDESVRFYSDPNSEIGIYTEQSIPKDRIKVHETDMLRKQ